ncbi:MAG: 5-methylthioadenosine/S-adenosylhomocysteine deaminase [Acidobacteriota bacterium]|jgi:5-methylthioadenosine/S-adenosylhomocysteine deaminase|nr:5-methylthioadenosine/S-adenosylhomocysteine deaminase [Acidobacteriota bacterium]
MSMTTNLRSIVAIILMTLISAPLASAQKRSRADLVILGGTIVTMDNSRRVIEDGAVAVSGGRIVAVGSRAEIEGNYSGRETIDARGRVVIPGLINGHTHVPMTLFRGLADDLDLQEWLTKYIFPAEAKNVSEEFVRVGTRLGLAEMIRGGTTTYCDMYYFEDAIADETVKAGVRGVLGETVIDFPVADNKTWPDAMAYTERFVKKWKGNALITPAIAPHAPYTVSEDHLKEVRDFSRRTGAPVVIHVSETRKEVDDITKSKGVPPVDYLARIGLLNDRVIAAHIVHPTAEELTVLKRLGVGVVHNPQSNMKLASGVAPVPQMLQADLNLGLGTDGAASNNDLNMWEEMDTAAKLHKVFTMDPKVVTAQQAFEMATIRGARALHLEREIGSIEKGKRADLVIVDLDDLNQTPSYNIYSDLVYATKADDVRTVIIEGRVVMRDRSLLTLDEKDIKARARVFREQIIKSLAPSTTQAGKNPTDGLAQSPSKRP